MADRILQRRGWEDLRQQKKVNKPNQQSRMQNISSFLNATALIICKQKSSGQAVSASVHLLSIGLLSYLFAVSAEANYSTMGHIT